MLDLRACLAAEPGRLKTFRLAASVLGTMLLLLLLLLPLLARARRSRSRLKKSMTGCRWSRWSRRSPPWVLSAWRSASNQASRPVRSLVSELKCCRDTHSSCCRHSDCRKEATMAWAAASMARARNIRAFHGLCVSDSWARRRRARFAWGG